MAGRRLIRGRVSRQPGRSGLSNARKRKVALELSQQFAGIRQGMKVVDEAGDVLGQVRDFSQRSLLIMEAGSPRVFWVDGAEIAAVEGQFVRLKRRIAAPAAATTRPSPA